MRNPRIGMAQKAKTADDLWEEPEGRPVGVERSPGISRREEMEKGGRMEGGEVVSEMQRLGRGI